MKHKLETVNNSWGFQLTYCVQLDGVTIGEFSDARWAKVFSDKIFEEGIFDPPEIVGEGSGSGTPCTSHTEEINDKTKPIGRHEFEPVRESSMCEICGKGRTNLIHILD